MDDETDDDFDSYDARCTMVVFPFSARQADYKEQTERSQQRAVATVVLPRKASWVLSIQAPPPMIIHHSLVLGYT
jgi:hypothetical protein